MSTDGEILRNFLGSRDIYRRPASSYPVVPSHWQVRDQDGQPYQHQITGTSLTTRLFGRGRRGLLQSCAAPPQQVAMLDQPVCHIQTPSDPDPDRFDDAFRSADVKCPIVADGCQRGSLEVGNAAVDRFLVALVAQQMHAPQAGVIGGGHGGQRIFVRYVCSGNITSVL